MEDFSNLHSFFEQHLSIQKKFYPSSLPSLTTDLGLHYTFYEGKSFSFIYDALNHFMIDKDGFIRWFSPVSDGEKISVDKRQISFFLSEHQFEVSSKDGFLVAKPPSDLICGFDDDYENSFKKSCSITEKVLADNFMFQDYLDGLQRVESPFGMNYFKDGLVPLVFQFDSINWFIIDNDGFIRWYSPGSHLETISEVKSITDFLDKHEFIWDIKDGKLRAQPPIMI